MEGFFLLPKHSSQVYSDVLSLSMWLRCSCTHGMEPCNMVVRPGHQPKEQVRSPPRLFPSGVACLQKQHSERQMGFLTSDITNKFGSHFQNSHKAMSAGSISIMEASLSLPCTWLQSTRSQGNAVVMRTQKTASSTVADWYCFRPPEQGRCLNALWPPDQDTKLPVWQHWLLLTTKHPP